MLAALVGAAVAPGLGVLMPGPAWLTLAAKTAVLDLVFLLAFWLVAVRSEERAGLLARATRLWPGARVAPETAA
jgi:hypothetical protein